MKASAQVEGNGFSICLHFLVTVLDVTVPSPRGFGSFPFPISLHETENSCFETKKTKRK